MSKILTYISGFLLILILCAKSQDNWVWQNPELNNGFFKSTYFVDEHTGWVVGDFGSVLKTSYGGVSG